MNETVKQPKTDYRDNGSAEFKNLHVGERLSQVNYLTIIAIQGMNLVVRDHRGVEFSILQEGAPIDDNMVNRQMHSATQYKREIKGSATMLLEAFSKAGDAVFQISFQKQIDPIKAFDAIKTGNKLKSHAEQKVAFLEAIKGEERILIGYVLDADHGLGRSLVYDLDAQAPRLVDHRGVNWLVLKGVKYIVGKSSGQ